MHSDLIGKIEKARQYAYEPERIVIEELHARFHGSNNDHIITLTEDHWTCDCRTFDTWGTCAHIMALQKILYPMLPVALREGNNGTNPDTHPAYSSLIGKIEKARQYTFEPERIVIEELRARFRGSNNDHIIRLVDGNWTCDCEFFRMWQTCAHVMALQKLLDPMLSTEAQQAGNPVVVQEEMASVLS